MKTLKRMLVAFMVVLMLVPMTAFAASSPKKVSIKNAVAVAAETTYNGKKQTADVTVTYDGEELEEGVDYVLKRTTAKSAGTYYVTVKGIGKFKGTTTAKYVVRRATQKVTVSGKKVVKASALKNKKAVLKLTASKEAKNAKVTFTSLSKKVKVNNNGKVVLKKGLKAGTYKIKVTVGGGANYKAVTKTIKIKVK